MSLTKSEIWVIFLLFKTYLFSFIFYVKMPISSLKENEVQNVESCHQDPLLFLVYSSFCSQWNYS